MNFSFNKIPRAKHADSGFLQVHRELHICTYAVIHTEIKGEKQQFQRWKTENKWTGKRSGRHLKRPV